MSIGFFHITAAARGRFSSEDPPSRDSGFRITHGQVSKPSLNSTS